MVLLIAETVNTGLDFGIIWEPLIRNFGHISPRVPHFLASDPVVTSFISTIVQIYYGWRVRVFTKSNLLAGLVFLLAFVSLASGVTSTILVTLNPEFSDIPKFQWMLMIWLSSSVRYKRDTLDVTVSVANKIILLTIQTGTITSLAAIADVLTFNLIKNSTIQFIWDFSLSKLYTNSMLSTLNSREEWKKMLEADDGLSGEIISDIAFHSRSNRDTGVASNGDGRLSDVDFDSDDRITGYKVERRYL
ncbi:hypothetical protein D9758_012262 [Tetrapyrgos nigripes]|uniref:DUF6534 domain-containing protein n=1 Tax=Tetrapyrgos nigripes TaxID=182062 RepID=A0A8H5FLP9_9AGAR|nr:hypothetical protein D9758_012262 [Tetrapyrgos nigripes]